MKFITNFFLQRMSKELPKPIGTWNIETYKSKINKKNDISYENHCSQFAKTKQITQNETKMLNEKEVYNCKKERDEKE